MDKQHATELFVRTCVLLWGTSYQRNAAKKLNVGVRTLYRYRTHGIDMEHPIWNVLLLAIDDHIMVIKDSQRNVQGILDGIKAQNVGSAENTQNRSID